VLERLLPDSFALTREASVRALGMRHFDVQLVGGMALHRGMIAEMKTGEGKTLVATLPCVLNSLEGKGVHVVTVNDYLARRDAEWMGRLYRALGLTTGCVVHGLTDKQRQHEYGCDITYGQNNEFGFDYLRDNMKFRLQDYVQRELHYAIVDEVDSILIDEARTPLIISGPSEESTDKYYKINKVIPGLVRDRDFTVDEKARSVVLTDEGVEKVEQKLGVQNLYDPEEIETLHHVEQALRAHTLYRKDHEYVVKDGEVIIVDDFTGRLMPGRSTRTFCRVGVAGLMAALLLPGAARSVPALAAKLTAVDPEGNRVLPVLYSDNYVTVLPGEPRRVNIRCPAGAQCSRIQIRGWNVEPAVLSIVGP